MGDRKIPWSQLVTLIGSRVWYRTQESDFNSGVVTAIKNTDQIQIRPDKNPENLICVPVDEVFQRQEHLFASNYERFSEQMNRYCDGIQTVEDLVKFCYTHNMSDKTGTVDGPASGAARKMAKKLLGIEVDEEAAAIEKEMGIEGDF